MKQSQWRWCRLSEFGDQAAAAVTEASTPSVREEDEKEDDASAPHLNDCFCLDATAAAAVAVPYPMIYCQSLLRLLLVVTRQDDDDQQQHHQMVSRVILPQSLFSSKLICHIEIVPFHSHFWQQQLFSFYFFRFFSLGAHIACLLNVININESAALTLAGLLLCLLHGW